MKLALTLTAASLLAASSFVAAEQKLSLAEMDGISAGGFAVADALADAVNANDAFAATATLAESVVVDEIVFQVGGVGVVASLADAFSEAAAGPALALGGAIGTTLGATASDTISFTASLADGGVPGAANESFNTSIALSNIRGLSALANSASTSAAYLGTSVPAP